MDEICHNIDRVQIKFARSSPGRLWLTCVTGSRHFHRFAHQSDPDDGLEIAYRINH